MHRICSSLSGNGFDVVLVGRNRPGSRPLTERMYQQKRLTCLFHKGFLFYLEYNIRLFFFLLFKRVDIACAIDLDTILPVLIISWIKGCSRVYDAHEYFTELKEVRTRKKVRAVWHMIERVAVPRFSNGYTVSRGLADAFKQNYGRDYVVIRNLPVLRELVPSQRKSFLVYQGAVNEGRAFEYLIPAMQWVPWKLIVCGDGNYMPKLKSQIQELGLETKIELKGMMLPEDLFTVAQQASIGIGLAEKEGINQFFALPNKFLEYMHAGLPQITMAYPEYQIINDEFEVAVLLENLDPENIAKAINQLIADPGRQERLHLNALKAREHFCWQKEEHALLAFYKNLSNHD
jgi:glycosyltransferase involved in cell wall biosynthesis